MKKHIDNDKILNHEHFGFNADAVSNMETTGLIPSGPNSEEERDAYKDIDKYQQNPISDNRRTQTPPNETI
jgi:hypothetical protein